MIGRQRRESPRVSTRASAASAPRLFLPQGYEPGYDYPLLVWIGDDARFDLGRTMARTSLRNYVAVATDPRGRTERSVWRAIDTARARAAIHPGRIFLVGQASGTALAFRTACRHAGIVAGVVGLGGGFPLDEPLFADLERIRRLPMLLCRSRDDVAADAARVDRTLRLFHAAGAVLSLRIYPGRAASSCAVLADLNRWLMDEICGPTAPRAAQCVR